MTPTFPFTFICHDYNDVLKVEKFILQHFYPNKRKLSWLRQYQGRTNCYPLYAGYEMGKFPSFHQPTTSQPYKYDGDPSTYYDYYYDKYVLSGRITHLPLDFIDNPDNYPEYFI